jgi:hypothetical protein
LLRGRNPAHGNQRDDDKKTLHGGTLTGGKALFKRDAPQLSGFGAVRKPLALRPHPGNFGGRR